MMYLIQITYILRQKLISHLKYFEMMNGEHVEGNHFLLLINHHHQFYNPRMRWSMPCKNGGRDTINMRNKLFLLLLISHEGIEISIYLFSEHHMGKYAYVEKYTRNKIF